MNSSTAKHVADAAYLLSPSNEELADSGSTGGNGSSPALLNWLDDLTNGSYDAWLDRGGATASVD